VTIRQAIWRIGPKPEPLQNVSLVNEAQLEDMIVAAPSILHDQRMLIGRQVDTGFGGRLGSGQPGAASSSTRAATEAMGSCLAASSTPAPQATLAASRGGGASGAISSAMFAMSVADSVPARSSEAC
jgi:hypothetical protein